MRVIYRSTDKVVFWIEPELRILDDYLEPIWRDDLKNAFHTQLQVPPGEKRFIDNSLRIVNDEPVPSDMEEIILWRQKVETLNLLARYLSLKRTISIPPIANQEQVYKWKVDEAREYRATGRVGKLLESWAKLKGLTPEDTATAILMKDEQYYSMMHDTEEERQRYVHLIQLASDSGQVRSISYQITSLVEAL